ncbi:MAG: VOC family protein [Pseudomonas sp.]
MLEGRHYQNAYVTRDIDRAVADFRARADVRTVIQFDNTSEVTTPKGRESLVSRLAFIWVGNLQYELIQPVSGAEDLYASALRADDTPAFHHICMRVDDWDSFRARVDRQSLPVVLEGGNESLRFLYLDAREFLGHYLEYTWMSAERWAQIGGE